MKCSTCTAEATWSSGPFRFCEPCRQAWEDRKARARTILVAVGQAGSDVGRALGAGREGKRHDPISEATAARLRGAK